MGRPRKAIKRRGNQVTLFLVGTAFAVTFIAVSLTLQVTFFTAPVMSSLKARFDLGEGSTNGYKSSINDANMEWDKSSKLPRWTEDYFRWHKETRFLERSKGFTINSTDTKYLVVQCQGACGGLADRLKLLPFYILYANQTQRVLMFRWKNPFPLEEFLEPPEGGMDWRVPHWLAREINFSHTDFTSIERSKGRRKSRKQILTAHVQSHAPHVYFNKEVEGVEYRQVFGKMFRALFQLSPPLQKMTDATMTDLGLKPGQYTAAHVRSRHRMKNDDGRSVDKVGGLKFEHEAKDRMMTSSMTAINCAAKSQDLRTIYFASDSHELNDYIMEECAFADKASPVKVVAQQYEQEPLHLDTPHWENKTVEEFYPTFRDLWILGNSKCVSYGVGGYGHMGMLLSEGAPCSHNYQRLQRTIECPSVIGSYIGGKCVDNTLNFNLISRL